MENDSKEFVLANETFMQDVLAKLKFVSKIKIGEKIDVDSLTMVSANSWGSSVYRTYRTILWTEESRDVSHDFLQKLTDDAFELTRTYLSQKEEYYKVLGNKILLAILESVKGIQNLIKTYANDRLYVSKLETLIQVLQAKSRDINNHFPIK